MGYGRRAAVVASMLLCFSGTASGAATAADVNAAIGTASTLRTLPSNLTPALSQFTPANSFKLKGASIVASCDAYGGGSKITNPSPCYFGDLRSKRTIVLVGDSNTANWVPALRTGLVGTGFRLAVFLYSGCHTPDLTYSQSQLTNVVSAANCNTWHRRVVPAIRALKPVAVAGVSIAHLPTDPKFRQADWVSGYAKLLLETTTGIAGAKRIVIGSSPYFQESVPTCLSIHANPFLCSAPIGAGSSYSAIVGADPAIAAAAKATLVPTYPYFCDAARCYSVINSMVTEVDEDHMTITYSNYLSSVFTKALLTAVRS